MFWTPQLGHTFQWLAPWEMHRLYTDEYVAMVKAIEQE